MALDFHYSFGFRNTKKCVAFHDNNTVIFAAGKMCFLYALDTGFQKLFCFAEHAEITAIVRCDVFIAGAIRSLPASVCLFNTLSETKKFYLAPASMKSRQFTSLSMSVNLKFLAAQGTSPDWILVIWFSNTREIAQTFQPAKTYDACVHDISFHAAGRDELVVVGEKVLRLYEYAFEEEEDKYEFKELIFEKFEKFGIYHAICWPEKENLAVCTSKGRLLFFRGIELVLEIDLEKDVKRTMQWNSAKIEENDVSVVSIDVTTRQLVCVFGGFVVLVYDGEEIASYSLTKFIFLPIDVPTRSVPGEVKERPDRLMNIIISPNGKDLIATTREGQMLRCREFAKGDKHQQFDNLIQRQHNGPVIGLDVSQGKPLIASCSYHSLICYNYCDKKQELRKKFKDEIVSVAIHPSGLYMALGFEYYCRIFSILYHELRERKFILCKNCSQVGFSTGGHLLAIVTKSIIEIYSFVTSALMFKLDGHAGLVTSFDWIEHDTKMISCDIRGVVCEWDLVSSKKIWEVTAILSYTHVAANSLFGSFIALTSGKSIRCFKNSSLERTLNSIRDVTYAIFSNNGQIFYVGTSDGCIESNSYPVPNQITLIHAHSGRVSALKRSFKYDFLISSGNDNCIFLWKTLEDDNSAIEGVFSNLCLVDISHLEEQKDKTKQLHLSLQHADTSSDCEFELSRIKHVDVLRTIVLDHEQKVDGLNENIRQIKIDIQTILFDSDPKKDRNELATEVRQEIVDTIYKLNEAYKKSNAYANETNKILVNYENTMDLLTAKHAKFSCAESNTIEDIKGKIKFLESTLLVEKEISSQAQLMCEDYKKKTESKMIEETVGLNNSQKALLEGEESKLIQIQLEIEKLQKLAEFKAQDTLKRRNIIAGQVDYDIKEKINAITLLRKNFQKLECILESKEKDCQKQEKKFCELRKLVRSSKKYYSVTKTAIEELTNDINKKQAKIDACQEPIQKILLNIPHLQEEFRVAKEMCSTVDEKLRESIDGYHMTEKMLRDILDLTSRYQSMLIASVEKGCDPKKLVGDIINMFEESDTGFMDDKADTRLLDEYDYQIDKLKSSYETIKKEPSEVLREKSMAEFRLSQKNSKILREVHEIQKDVEKLRCVISEMEAALGLQAAQAKGAKFADELRKKIEFVIEATKINKEERLQKIGKLDMVIEEQQKEIERFQTILAGKLKK